MRMSRMCRSAVQYSTRRACCAAHSSREHRVGSARVGAEQLVVTVAVREYVCGDRRLLDYVVSISFYCTSNHLYRN